MKKRLSSGLVRKLKKKKKFTGPRRRVAAKRAVKKTSVVELPPIHHTSSVQKTIDKISTSQDDRKRQEIAIKLGKIHERVELYEEIEFSLSRPPFLDREADKRQLAYQRAILEMISNFASSCEERACILNDSVEWFIAAQEVLSDVRTDDEMKKQEIRFTKMFKSISQAYNNAKAAAFKIEKIGYQLLEDAGYLEDDEEEEEAVVPVRRGKAKQPLQPIEIIDEDALFEDTQSWMEAVNEIKRVLGETIRQVKTNQAKSMVRSALKQYKFVTAAVEHRLADAVQKDEQIVDLQVKAHQLTNTNEKQKKEIQQVTTKRDNLEHQLDKVTRDWEQESKAKKDLKKQVATLASENDDLKERIEEVETELARQPSFELLPQESEHVPTPVPPPKSSVHLVQRPPPAVETIVQIKEDPVLQEKVVNLTLELETCKAQYEELDENYKELDKNFKKKLAMINRLENKVREIEEIEEVFEAKKDSSSNSLEQDNKRAKAKLFKLHKEKDGLLKKIDSLNEHLTAKDELLQSQEIRINELAGLASAANQEKTKQAAKKEPKLMEPKSQSGTENDAKLTGKIDELKRIIARMKKDHEGEISRLKDHIEREKQRNEATIRRVENLHKDQLLNVHKSSVHLLRGMNRFKEAVVEILEKEYLLDAAHDVKIMEDLPTDESPTDPRSTLMQLSGNAVELLLSLETKLSKALMDKRLEMKDKTLAKQFAAKDLDAQIEYTKKLKKENELLTEKLKVSRENLMATDQALKDVRKHEGVRYTALMERYKQVWHQNRSLSRDMENSQRSFAESLKLKEEAYQQLLANKQEMFKSLESQKVAIKNLKLDFKHKKEQTENSYQLSVKDMRKNLGTLRAALKAQRISNEMYEITASLIEKAMEVPAIRMQELLKTYIAYKKLQAAKEHLVQLIKDKPADDKIEELRAHINRMDTQLTDAMSKWQDKKENLNEEKREMFGKMAKMFDDVVTETGILLILPKKLESPIQSPSPVFHGVDTLRSGGAVILKPLEMPEGLIGRRFTSIGEDSVWQAPIPSICNLSSPRIEVPKIMDLEINATRRHAMKALSVAVTKNKTLHLPSAKGYEYRGLLKPFPKNVSHTTERVKSVRSLGTVNIPS